VEVVFSLLVLTAGLLLFGFVLFQGGGTRQRTVPASAPVSPSLAPAASNFRGLLAGVSLVVVLAAICSLVGGGIVGLIVLGSNGLAAGVQRAIGLVLLGASGLSGVAALIELAWGRTERRTERRAAPARRRELLVASLPPPQRAGWQVAGTLVSAPTALAPLSRRPCVLWSLALQRLPSRGIVWEHTQLADLAIQYDRTRTVHEVPGARRAGQREVTEAPGGTLTIPRVLLHLTHLTADRERTCYFPLTAVHLQPLVTAGLPGPLQEETAARPTAYQVAEYVLTTGEFVTGYQQTARAGSAHEPEIPDPTMPVELRTASRKEERVSGNGCLASLFCVGGLLMLVLGLALLHR
jgi:hypothetical protein